MEWLRFKDVREMFKKEGFKGLNIWYVFRRFPVKTKKIGLKKKLYLRSDIEQIIQKLKNE